MVRLKLRTRFLLTNKPLFNLNDFFGLEIQNPSMFVTTNKLESEETASCVQTHSNNVKYVDKPGIYKNVDGLVTNLENKIKLVIQTADCVPIFITDLKKKNVGLVHSGWKGTANSIIISAISIFINEGSDIKDISVYLGPCIKKCCYEIKDDVSKFFDNKFIIKKNKMQFLDLESKIFDDVLKIGLSEKKLFKSNICTFENKNFFSFRRDNKNSGRMYSYLI